VLIHPTERKRRIAKPKLLPAIVGVGVNLGISVVIRAVLLLVDAENEKCRLDAYVKGVEGAAAE
jgi:hypothetical protein